MKTARSFRRGNWFIIRINGTDFFVYSGTGEENLSVVHQATADQMALPLHGGDKNRGRTLTALWGKGEKAVKTCCDVLGATRFWLERGG